MIMVTHTGPLLQVAALYQIQFLNFGDLILGCFEVF